MENEFIFKLIIEDLKRKEMNKYKMNTTVEIYDTNKEVENKIKVELVEKYEKKTNQIISPNLSVCCNLLELFVVCVILFDVFV